jgi:26S proteasome regulatory subunit N11
MQDLFNLGGFGDLLGSQGGARRRPATDAKMNDTAEQIYISPLCLLKMLRHGKAGIPVEVMGLMIGDYIDEYTVKCVDVFAMPQAGAETTVESIDEKFQVDMLEKLKQTGRTNEVNIGWYHSHPGYGCWLSSTDINTQKAFERQEARTVAVVIDPIQSVRGKVVIDAFRTYGGMGLSLGDTDQRQTTSNLGEVKRTKGFSLKELSKISYYSILIGYRKNDLETKMLLNLKKSFWDSGFKLMGSKKEDEENLKKIDDINKLSQKYVSWIEGEINKSSKDIYLDSVGKYNPRDHLENTVEDLVTDNLNTCLTSMLNNLVF